MTLEQIKQQLYTESPYDLGTDQDSAFGTGVNYTLENKYIVKAVNSYDESFGLLDSALLYLKNNNDYSVGVKKTIKDIEKYLKENEA